MLLSLLAMATAADPSPARHEVRWWDQPTAEVLVPVRPQPFGRHRALTFAASAGPGASPVYRDAWTRMEVQLALTAQGVDAPPLSPEEAARYRDLAFAAAALGAQDLFDETLHRSPLLGPVYELATTTFAPGFELRGGPGGPRLSTPGPGAARRDAQELARLQEPNLRRPPQPPPVSLSVGSGWALRPSDPDDPLADLDLGLSAWLNARNLGADALRLSVSVLPSGPDAPRGADAALVWTASLREQLAPGWSLLGELRSSPSSPSPALLRAGLAWQPLPAHPAWNLRATWTSQAPMGPAPPRHVAELRVQWAGGWVAPAAPGRWPAEPSAEEMLAESRLRPPIQAEDEALAARPDFNAD